MKTPALIIVMGAVLLGASLLTLSGYRSFVYLKSNYGDHPTLCLISALGLAVVIRLIWYVVSDLYPYFFPHSPNLYERYGWGSALVTGASDGLGYAYSKQLASQGFELIMHGRNKMKLEAKKADILKQYPNTKIHILLADLSQSLTDETKREILQVAQDKKVSILFNNAGMGALGDFRTVELPITQQVISLNVLAPTDLMKLLIPVLNLGRPKRSALINVSSISSEDNLPGIGLYSATKTYLSTLTRCVAYEQSDSNVDFLNLMPGPVLTQLFTIQSDLTVIGADDAAERHFTFIGHRLETFGAFIHWLRVHITSLGPRWLRRKVFTDIVKIIFSAMPKPS